MKEYLWTALYLDNLHKMDQFLERHNVPKFTQEETDDLNRLKYIKEIESITNNLQNRAPSPDEFTDEIYWTFKKEIIPILYNLFQRIRIRRNTS